MGDAPVLRGHNIICLPILPWNGPWKAYHQVMSRLAERNRVFCVDPPRPLRQVLSDLRHRSPTSVVEEVRPGLFVYYGPRLLARFRRSAALTRLSVQARLLHARVIARRLGFQSPILWIYDPLLAGTGGSFSEKLMVYHVVDDYVEYAPRAATALRAAIAAGEAAMLDRADVVFAVSEALYDRCRRRARNVHLVPNAVDAERFRLAAADPRIPDDIAAIRRPLIGYVGVIQSTVDTPLMTQLASRRPDWSIVLVGPLDLGEGRRELDALLALPNVHYLGQKSVADVPYYIKSCDVCLMMDDERARGDVIKTYEYLAAGRPTVAKSTPSALRFGRLVSIASDARSFETAIAQALAEDGSLTSERMAAVQEHTWDHRVALIADAIEQLLPPTAAPATRAADATSYGSLA